MLAANVPEVEQPESPEQDSRNEALMMQDDNVVESVSAEETWSPRSTRMECASQSSSVQQMDGFIEDDYCLLDGMELLSTNRDYLRACLQVGGWEAKMHLKQNTARTPRRALDSASQSSYWSLQSDE